MNNRGGGGFLSQITGSAWIPGAAPTSKHDQKRERKSDPHDEVGNSERSISKSLKKAHLRSNKDHKGSRATLSEPKLKETAQGNGYAALSDLTGENFKLRSRLQKLEDDGRIQESTLSNLTAKLHNSSGEIQRLSQAVANADKEMMQRETERQDLLASIQNHEAEIQTLRAKEQSLRDFVLDSKGDQAISGDDMVGRFTNLRQKIQKLATNKAYRLGQEESPLGLKNSLMDPSLSKLWGKSPRPSRLLILRGLIFQIVDRYILSYETFDINEAVASDIGDLADTLGRFERTVVRSGVPRDVVVHWRLSTFKCIENAQLGGKDFGRELQAEMYECFSHLIDEEAAEQDKTKLRDGFLELCKEAWNLRLLMRKSREPYECWSIKRDSIKSLEPWCEVFDEISDDAGMGEDIAFTLFGALIKQSQIRGEEPMVLEKAHIVVANKKS
ncbi:hypothetical protein ACHAQJ_000276 [Trichoderma viride]